METLCFLCNTELFVLFKRNSIPEGATSSEPKPSHANVGASSLLCSGAFLSSYPLLVVIAASFAISAHSQWPQIVTFHWSAPLLVARSCGSSDTSGFRCLQMPTAIDTFNNKQLKWLMKTVHSWHQQMSLWCTQTQYRFYMFPRSIAPEVPFLRPQTSITAPHSSSLTIFYVGLYVFDLRFLARS